jgi:cell wall-associated NlpC family hydrolase
MLRRALAPVAALLLGLACRPPAPTPLPPPLERPLPAPRPGVAPRLGFTIQAGAFAKVENAARLSERLREQGLEATWYAAPDRLFKVRFGDFATREEARARAEALRAAGVIETYYLVAPGPRPAAPEAATSSQREGLVRTAQSFLGLPYLWGGTSPETGFDCSGLAMAVYRLNGLRLPRNSREQFEAGIPVGTQELRKGDLLFFATTGGGRVSHVAVYVGDGAFIHAPGRGRGICRDTLANPILSRQFLGGRTYL